MNLAQSCYGKMVMKSGEEDNLLLHLGQTSTKLGIGKNTGPAT